MTSGSKQQQRHVGSSKGLWVRSSWCKKHPHQRMLSSVAGQQTVTWSIRWVQCFCLQNKMKYLSDTLISYIFIFIMNINNFQGFFELTDVSAETKSLDESYQHVHDILQLICRIHWLGHIISILNYTFTGYLDPKYTQVHSESDGADTGYDIFVWQAVICRQWRSIL